MNDELVTDLKQFIATTVSQQLAEQDERFNAKIESLDIKLSQKIDDLTSFVTETVDATNETTDKQFVNHEKRIAKLEHAAA